jgi:glyoxylase-like metal-dependent hydrolase (beta-lactamase superfamily II)
MRVQRFGELEVHKVVEIDRMAVDAEWLLSNITDEIVEENKAWLTPNLVEPGTNRLVISFHSYVIKTPQLNILVDTCNGNDKHRPSVPAWDRLNLPYLQRLKDVGLSPEDIDIVMCTHLHTDHVGWNTRLENGRWVPTFPRARYLMSRADFVYFDKLHRSNPSQPVNRGSFADSVLPVVESGLAEFVDPGDVVDARLTKGITLEDAAGHSPGNLNIVVRAGGREACMCGDVIHHPIQCAVPELSSSADYDGARAFAARRDLLARCADSGAALLAAHFPEPTAGRVVAHGDRFRFSFAA